ncbi:1,6-anhydro-N-acetylmuramyl-L-alanine amidase AmpD [Piscinibacter sakaiensis]|uniref:1,6-anhydro-N-acetylmuramyl-L-alanine amidase AmpD n=1 Tax=Piscinibacter sakaiensis TaxID=1547922 RepID=UPI003AAE1D61
MRRASWIDGWYQRAKPRPSPNHGPRPAGVSPWLVVLHSISLPPGIYQGDAIERLFTNRLDCDEHPYFDGLRGVEVSAHFVIRRSGRLMQFVSCERRAWHAGASHWRGADNCNDFSIGIELEGLEGERFDARQYPVLCRLLRALARRYPLREVVGHEHVAPGRKGDPGAGFDWLELAHRTGWPRRRFPPLCGGLETGSFPKA